MLGLVSSSGLTSASTCLLRFAMVPLHHSMFCAMNVLRSSFVFSFPVIISKRKVKSPKRKARWRGSTVSSSRVRLQPSKRAPRLSLGNVMSCVGSYSLKKLFSFQVSSPNKGELSSMTMWLNLKEDTLGETV